MPWGQVLAWGVEGRAFQQGLMGSCLVRVGHLPLQAGGAAWGPSPPARSHCWTVEAKRGLSSLGHPYSPQSQDGPPTTGGSRHQHTTNASNQRTPWGFKVPGHKTASSLA